MAIMPTSFAPPPLSELGIGFDNLDPESLILLGLEGLETVALNTLGTGLLPSNVNGYDFRTLRYPYDIEHMFMHGHYINFYINVPVYSRFYNKGTSTPGPGGTTIETPGSFDYMKGSQFEQSYEEKSVPYIFGEELPSAGGLGGTLNSARTTRIAQAISLYIPDSMSYGSGINYEHTDAFSQGEKALSALNEGTFGLMDKVKVTKMISALSGWKKLGEIVGGATGFALNEQLLVIFRGMGLRSFQYDFFFSPKSKEEARNIQNIIAAFRFHAHPEIVEGLGMFYIAPGTFDIEFMHKDDRNKCIHQVKTCVLVDYNVDYAPFGWSTHDDGMPVQTKLTLTFKETQVITKDDIIKGF